MWAVIGLACAMAVAGYILILYPLLLAKVPWPQRPAVRKDLNFRTTVTAVMSVYNGAAYLRNKLDSFLALDFDPALLQILVVSDGSTDATESIAREYAARGVELLVCPHAGKASALNAAFEHATGEILFFTDVRQRLDPQVLKHLVANFADTTIGAVTGEMRLSDSDVGEHKDMGLYWRYELWARARHGEIDSLFNTTGCVYAMRRSLVSPLLADTLSDDAVLPLGAFFKGYRVIFDREALVFDYPAALGTEFRRRWRNLAGLWQVHVRMPQLFTSANRMRFHFLSHKFARLVMPWALLAMVGATTALPYSVWRTTLLSVEAAIAFLGLVDGWIRRGPFKRLTSPARTFLLMNAASLAAPAVFLVPAQNLWKPTRVSEEEIKA